MVLRGGCLFVKFDNGFTGYLCVLNFGFTKFLILSYNSSVISLSQLL